MPLAGTSEKENRKKKKTNGSRTYPQYSVHGQRKEAKKNDEKK